MVVVPTWMFRNTVFKLYVRVGVRKAKLLLTPAKVVPPSPPAALSYSLRRMRWLGLAKAGLQVRLAAMAYNLRRSWRLLGTTAA